MHSGTPAGPWANQYLDLESNQDLDLRRVPCDPLHHRDKQSRRLGSHQHEPPSFLENTGKTGAFLSSSHVSRSSRSVGSRTLSGGFGDRLLSQEHTPVVSTGPAPARSSYGWHDNYVSSVTFQYASLTNFDQLAIRSACEAYNGFQVGRTGGFRNRKPACSGVRSAFRLLQARHASTQFSQMDVPPCERGKTWSIVNSSLPGCTLQYWQV